MSSYNGEDNKDVSPDAEPVTTPETEEMTDERPLMEEEPEALSENIQPELELEAGVRAGRPNFLTATRFADFDLPPEIVAGIDNAGFEYCTPIQAQAIPVAMSGQDIAGQAQTGTGKTTAFLVPLLYRLLKNKPLEPHVPRAIIVTPTRELALQIHEDALVLAGATNLRQVLVIGGMDYKEQAELLKAAPEIVICTPGRIIDYLQQGVFKTKGIEVAVVDEADRLLDMGFIKDLKYLLGKLPPFTQRQTMLFSATLDERVLELTYQFMNPPQFITAEPDKNTRVNIEQELYHVGRDEKLPLLLGLLRREPHRRVIIFSNTKSGVEWLAKKLTMNGFQAEGITGDLPQPKRLKLMEAFKENRLQILVATDVASRGIHVDDVSHVYNYDLPQDAENYVHRIGRTARAGHEGKAVSFGCEDYVFHLEAIENLLGEKIPVHWAEPEMFQEDVGGEVRLKDRRGGDRKRGGPTRGGGRESGPPRTSRGPAKSQRAGGIFGLAPRSSADGADLRHTLGWSPNGEVEPVIEGEFEEITVTEAEAPAEEQTRDGRRRKRRRGRRGRQPETGTGVESPVKAEAVVDEAIEVKVDTAAAPKPEAGEKDKKTKRPEREKSRYPRKRLSDGRATESEDRPTQAQEEIPQPAPASESAPAEATVKAPAAKKPKAAGQRAGTKKSADIESKAATAEVAETVEAKKPSKAEQDKKKVPAEKASQEPAKKPKATRATAKKAAEGPAKEAEAKKPAAPKTAAAKTAKKESPVKEVPDEAKKTAGRKPAAKKAETVDTAPAKKVAARKPAAAKTKTAEDKGGEKVDAKKPKVKKTTAKDGDESAPKAAKKPRKPAVKKETDV